MAEISNQYSSSYYLNYLTTTNKKIYIIEHYILINWHGLGVNISLFVQII